MFKLIQMLPKKVMIFLWLFIPLFIISQPYFEHSNELLPSGVTSINSMDVESVDVDNDGDLDLIIAGEYSRNLLLFNDGRGVFTEDVSSNLF